MYIYATLKTKPHNPHYLNRYIKFIERCRAITASSYSEKHHICPKAKEMFPELKDDPNNLIILPYRHHVVAHMLLYKAFENNSMATSLIFVSNQTHSSFVASKINTRLIEQAKVTMTDKRRGRKPHNFSPECRAKLSKNQTERYKDPANRERHSVACKGIKKHNTHKQKLASQNRTKEHQDKLSKSIKDAWHHKLESGYRVVKNLYITPYGVFTTIHPTYAMYCKNPDKAFTIHSFKFSALTIPKSCIGKTPRELGFYTIQKSSPEYSSAYAQLDQVHQLEPNHVLVSLLGDFPLLQKILPQK